MEQFSRSDFAFVMSEIVIREIKKHMIRNQQQDFEKLETAIKKFRTHWPPPNIDSIPFQDEYYTPINEVIQDMVGGECSDQHVEDRVDAFHFKDEM